MNISSGYTLRFLENARYEGTGAERKVRAHRKMLRNADSATRARASRRPALLTARDARRVLSCQRRAVA